MGPFEYLLLFAAVILGLAVSDLAINLSRLMKAGSRVRWDLLAPLAALVAFLKIVTQWWVWFRAEAVAGSLTFEMYMAVLVEAVLLFLLASSALPGEVPPDGIDLRINFERGRKRFWLLFAAQWLLWVAVSAWIQMGLEGARFSILQPGYLVLPVVLVALLARNRLVQGVILIGLSVAYFWQFLGTRLTG
jgi:hypothetical protein